jgi:hypothetical protein
VNTVLTGVRSPSSRVRIMARQDMRRDSQAISDYERPVSQCSMNYVLLLPASGRCLHKALGQLEASGAVQPANKVHIFHDGPISKSAYPKVGCSPNKESLVSVWELQEQGSKDGHKGNKIQRRFGGVDLQSEGAKNNARMGQSLIDEMLIPKGKHGVRMEKKQDVTARLMCPCILLDASTCV